MERELVMTGIGGQGIQLASTVVARAAVAEGRDVQLFGSYGGMMRGGATEATIVVADAPIDAPPTLGATWSAIIMHHEHADHAWGCLRPGSVVFANSTVLAAPVTDDAYTVIEVPATALAQELGHVMTASMVMIGAYAAATALVELASLLGATRASLPPYRVQHAELNERALRTGFAAVSHGSAPAWMSARPSEGTGERRGSGAVR